MGGWHLIDIRHVPLEGLAFKTVVRDLLMRPFWNCYQTSQALGMSTVECSRDQFAQISYSRGVHGEIHKTVVRHCGLIEKVYGSVTESVRR